MVFDRQLLIFVSDIHLTDSLMGGSVSRAAIFERFWTRIDVARRGRPARMVLVGDIFDLVRSPLWLKGEARPYHQPAGAVQRHVEQITDAIIERERDFLNAIRQRVVRGELEVSYILGNHDRLLAGAPRARRRVWEALTGEDRDVTFPNELVFPDHGVLAFHGHRSDIFNYEPDNQATVGDAIASELVVRFPHDLRAKLQEPLPGLDDIDDVRPIFTVPAWVRHFAARRKGILKPVSAVWRDTVEDFLDNPFVTEWVKSRPKRLLNQGRKLQLLLQLSTGRIMRKTSDHRLVQLYRFFQHLFDGRFAQNAAGLLQSADYRGLRYVVNGHSHFSSMVPLGQVDGRAACYFNTGTWRTVHQMGGLLHGRPAFIPYESMCYLVFFPDGDDMNRDYEWWSGAMVARGDHHGYSATSNLTDRPRPDKRVR